MGAIEKIKGMSIYTRIRLDGSWAVRVMFISEFHDVGHALKQNSIVSLDLSEAGLLQGLLFEVAHLLTFLLHQALVVETPSGSIFEATLHIMHSPMMMLMHYTLKFLLNNF